MTAPTFDLAVTEEQEAIVESVRCVLAEPLDWARCAELGWFGVGLPEAWGGVGFGVVEEALLHRELGRHVAAGSFVATTLAARVAAMAGADDVVGALLNGSARAGLALGTGAHCLAVDHDSGLVLRVHPTGANLYTIEAVRSGTAVDAIDQTTGVISATLEGVPVAAIDGPDVWHRLLVLGAAALTGVAERARDLAVEHAINRHQFGRPIGVNQAIKHPCADMALRVELAGAQVLVAALTVDAALPDAGLEATSAAAVAADAALANARAAVQVHGGLGFTAEHPVHTLVARAHVLERMVGGRPSILAALLNARATD